MTVGVQVPSSAPIKIKKKFGDNPNFFNIILLFNNENFSIIIFAFF